MAGIQAMATSLKMVKSGSEPDDLVIAHITSIGEQASEAEEIDVTTLKFEHGLKHSQMTLEH